MAQSKNAGAAKTTKKPASGAKTATKSTAKKSAPKAKTAPAKEKTAKKSKSTGKKNTSKTPETEIPRATPLEVFNNEVLGLALIALGVLFAIFLYGKMPEKGLGHIVYWLMFNAVGIVSYALPPFCVFMGVVTIAGKRRTPAPGRVPVFIMLILCVAALIHLMGGIRYTEPEAGANAARTLENAFNAFMDYIQNCSARALGTVKNASRGGGVIGGFICLLFYVIGGQGLAAVAVVAGLVISLLLVTRISVKTFPDYLKGSVSRLTEKIDPEDDGTEDTEYVPFSGKKRKFFEDISQSSGEAEGTAESEEEPDIQLGHLSELNDIGRTFSKKRKQAVKEDTGSDEYDGFFNNEPIDDTLPMEPELRVVDMRAEAKKRTAAAPVLFGAGESSFLRMEEPAEKETGPEVQLFFEEPEAPVKSAAPVKPAEIKAPAEKAAEPVFPEPVFPEPVFRTLRAPEKAEPAKAEPALFGEEQPEPEETAAPVRFSAADDTIPPKQEEEESPTAADASHFESTADMKEAFAARPYTAAEAAAEAADKPAPKFRPVDEVTGEPLPEVSEAPEVYEPFSLDCLTDPPKNYSKATDNPEQVGRLLIETLGNFGIEARLLEWSVGPVVTRYEIQPAPGVRVSKITGLSNDIALALAATRVRIEAPIPNKAAVGIEVPNKKAASVYLKEIVASEAFLNMKSPVAMAMGKDIGGKIVVADLAKMPHMLIAGSTGSGKSVCINNLILSMVYKSAPSDLRLILVDPKQVELSVYAHLPHLLIPVVTDPKKASSALRWAVNEMTLRYTKFSQRGARDLNRYNSLQTEEKEKLPRIVVIIDELADLMMVCPDEVEDSICRIAQLGRAAGIHLIVATQRPSSDVITGLIKANIPSRAAFAVSSAIDSRIILDAVGAEKLLGKGDCLFHPNGADKPTRLQAAFVSDEEVEQIMEHYKSDKAPTYEAAILESVNNTATGGAKGGVFGEGKQEDELLGEAVRIVLDSGQASISMIQRKLRVGYARAARLVDMMEEKGYVSGFDGSKPRKVIIKRAEFEQIFGDGSYIPPEEEEGANYEDGYVPEEYRE